MTYLRWKGERERTKTRRLISARINTTSTTCPLSCLLSSVPLARTHTVPAKKPRLPRSKTRELALFLFGPLFAASFVSCRLLCFVCRTATRHNGRVSSDLREKTGNRFSRKKTSVFRSTQHASAGSFVLGGFFLGE